MVLSEIEGFRNREIADILGISLDNVKIRLHRARAGLKKKLEGGLQLLSGRAKHHRLRPEESVIRILFPFPSVYRGGKEVIEMYGAEFLISLSGGSSPW